MLMGDIDGILTKVKMVETLNLCARDSGFKNKANKQEKRCVP